MFGTWSAAGRSRVVVYAKALVGNLLHASNSLLFDDELLAASNQPQVELALVE